MLAMLMGCWVTVYVSTPTAYFLTVVVGTAVMRSGRYDCELMLRWTDNGAKNAVIFAAVAHPI